VADTLDGWEGCRLALMLEEALNCGLDPADALTAVALILLLGPDGAGEAPLARLEDMTSFSEPRLSVIIRRLERAGIIAVHRPGAGRRNYYLSSLTWGRPWEVQG